MRTYLVVVDDTPEAAVALRFAARRAVKTGGGVTILAVLPPQEFNAFAGVQATMEAEARAHAEGLVAQAAGAILGESGIVPSILVREGDIPRAVSDAIAADPAVAALVLGAAASGSPGVLVSHFAGVDAGRLAVPVIIVPGALDAVGIDRLS